MQVPKTCLGHGEWSSSPSSLHHGLQPWQELLLEATGLHRDFCRKCPVLTPWAVFWCAQPVPNRDEPARLHLHPCDCMLCPVDSKWLCAKHVVSSQQRSALGCSGEPSCQRTAQISPALRSRPAFPPASPPINSQLCLGSLSLRILHGGPHISLINKVRKTGPLRKS